MTVAPIAHRPTYRRMNAAIARSVRSSTGAPLKRIGMTTSGLTVWSSSRRSTLPRRRWRTTLIEPVVEPAEPPANMSAKSVRSEMTGQSAKSAVANPVVVMTETDWKTAARTASSPSAIPYPHSWTSSAIEARRRRTPGTAGTPRRARTTRGRRRTRPRKRSTKFTPARSMKSAMIHCAAGGEGRDRVRLRREAAGRHRRRTRARAPRTASSRRRSRASRARRGGASAEPSARCTGPRGAVPSSGSARRSAPTSGPGSSASIICRPPTRRRGRMATARMMIPIPPSHCVNWRHMDSERESSSKSVTTLAPVVVEPRTCPRDRRRSGGRAARRRSNKYGQGRERGRMSSIADTTRKPSRTPTRVAPRVARSSAKPKALVTAPVTRNGPDGLAVPDRDPDREHDREAEVLREDADEVEDGGDVDGEPARPADPRDGFAHAGLPDLRAPRRPTVRSRPP